MANYSATFHALSDPTRRAVLTQLARGRASVNALAEGHEMALPSFLKHLKVLEGAGLILSEKQGRRRICRLNPQALRPAEDWLAQQRQEWEGRTDRLAAFVEKED
ncbi:ArsR/SmtB family transcription factor [Paracoccus tegillarcae]|uniref:Transcriptional regulator n=1 Tax=Paracoccus tegillarcae TaxID=1529068 RepID=A0A2K9F5Z3_9RHOB|nr:metalloregulator ArsR/SmtB family transcription factor [Paracoccus tegillarcae]AUH34601.1 transcriptional regulator [Paracoccus tegillarcae]